MKFLALLPLLIGAVCASSLPFVDTQTHEAATGCPPLEPSLEVTLDLTMYPEEVQEQLNFNYTVPDSLSHCKGAVTAYRTDTDKIFAKIPMQFEVDLFLSKDAPFNSDPDPVASHDTRWVNIRTSGKAITAAPGPCVEGTCLKNLYEMSFTNERGSKHDPKRHWGGRALWSDTLCSASNERARARIRSTRVEDAELVLVFGYERTLNHETCRAK